MTSELELQRADILRKALSSGENLPLHELEWLKQHTIEQSASSIDEMHPGVTMADRAILKNFSSSPQSGIAYLEKKYPGQFKYKTASNGEIQLRGHDESDYRYVDPPQMEFQDISDGVTDVLQGTGEGAAMASSLMTNVTNPAAAFAAKAAVGAGGEVVKQSIGSMFGIPDNSIVTDNGSLNKEAAFNAGASGLASATMPVIGKNIANAYNYTKGTIAPNLVSVLSGVDKDILKNIHYDAPARALMETPTKIRQAVGNFSSEVSDKINETSGKFGKAVDSATGDNVNLSSAKQKLLALLNGSSDEITDFQREQALTSGLDKPFMNIGTPTISDQLAGRGGDAIVSPARARQVRNSYYDDFITNDNASSGEKAVASKAYDYIKSAMSDSAIDKKSFAVASDKYHDWMTTINSNPKLKTFMKEEAYSNHKPEKMGELIQSSYKNDGFFGMPKRDTLDSAIDVMKEAGVVEPEKRFREITSARLFNNPSMKPISMASAGKGAGAGLSLGTALGFLTTGNYAGGLIGGGTGVGLGTLATSPWAILKSANAAKGTENLINKGVSKINPYILRATPKATYNLWDDREEE
jgi:hypothetical protein